MTRRTWLAGAILFAWCTLAHAEPTAAERETARALLVSGRAKRKAGQLHESLADLERAHGIMRVPTTGLDLGKTQRALNLLVEARATLLEAARYPVHPREPAAFTKARAEATQIADEIAPRLPSLTIQAQPPGTKVSIDNHEISASSIGTALKVNPGKHEVVATLENADDQRMSIELSERESKSISFELHPRAPVGENGTKPSGTKPPETAPPPQRPPKPVVTKTSPLVWIGLATAGVGTAVGATTGILALGVKSDLDADCFSGTKCPPTTHSELDRGQLLATVSTIGFAVAIVGAVVLVTGLLGVGRTTTTASLPNGNVHW